MNEPQLAYLSARVQGRWRTLPSESEWRVLEAIGNADAVLETARTGALKPWVAGLNLQRGVAGIERPLRTRWRNHVDEVAHWLPARWREAAEWADHIPRLPALDHLLRGGTPPEWTLSDPVLATLAVVPGREQRREALVGTALAPLAAHPDEPERAWFEHWQGLWPERGALVWASDQLVQSRAEADPVAIRRLRKACRRTLLTPALGFVHLGLVARHLQRLRGLLVRRALFSEQAA
ncbi:MAG: hypothetical protein ACQERR_03820 [Pseudomonadota bacterium]